MCKQHNKIGIKRRRFWKMEMKGERTTQTHPRSETKPDRLRLCVCVCVCYVEFVGKNLTKPFIMLFCLFVPLNARLSPGEMEGDEFVFCCAFFLHRLFVSFHFALSATYFSSKQAHFLSFSFPLFHRSSANRFGAFSLRLFFRLFSSFFFSTDPHRTEYRGW